MYTKIDKFWEKENGFECPVCKKQFSKKGIMTHIWRKHGDGKNHNTNSPVGKKGIKSWNNGLTKETDERIKNIGIKISENFKVDGKTPYWLGKNHKKESIEKMKNNCGGVRKGAGRGKHGMYKGYWCDSSWELAFVVYNLEHGIKLERNKNGFEYEFEGKTHKYFPDFIINGEYFEIKGYETKHTIAKLTGCPNLRVLRKEEMNPILNYVIEKYGKDFLNLYE